LFDESDQQHITQGDENTAVETLNLIFSIETSPQGRL